MNYENLMFSILLSCVLLFSACASPDAESPATEPTAAESPAAEPGAEAANVEATSFLGEPLLRPEPPAEFVAQQEGLLAEAKANREADSADADAWIWTGRRTAYLGRYNESIDIYGEAMERFPEDARFPRHRGHRYLTVRKTEEAIADFKRAAELIDVTPAQVEPDGLPNERGIPTSSLHSNVFYHLGLAHYVRGEFEEALSAYEKCQEYSDNPDMLVATTHWHYMTLRRLGRDDEAAALLKPIQAEMDIIENGSYHHLLMLYKATDAAESLPMPAEGEQLDRATIGYGVGNWELYNGRTDRAAEIFREILAAGPWASFGYLAAEADVARAAASDEVAAE